MTGRPLILPDELKALPKGRFIVTKIGCYPMRSTLRLFTEWGITFDNVWIMPENEPRPVAYVDRMELERAIERKYPQYAYSTLVNDDFDGEEDILPKRKPKLPLRGGDKYPD